MEYTNAEREQIKKSITPDFFDIIEKSYQNFIDWYNDGTLSNEHKEAILKTLICTATPSVLYPQYIRLEMIEYWKEKFSDYPKVIENLNNIK
jgi:hypothetical protein